MSSIRSRLRAFFFGPPKDVHDPHTFHKLSLVALLAWVGLGADGLSSSAYGPDEAFRALVATDTPGLAVVPRARRRRSPSSSSATATPASSSSSPSGGGGYVVATKLLGPRFGVVSGCALLVDYVLTITISIASGADAIFSLLPRTWFGRRSARRESFGYAIERSPSTSARGSTRCSARRSSSRSSRSSCSRS